MFSTNAIDPTIEATKREGLKRFRASRNQSKADESLKDLAGAAQGEENLMPFIFEAVKNRATQGEISDTLRKVFGQFKENVVV